jgi:hypothetical protein
MNPKLQTFVGIMMLRIVFCHFSSFVLEKIRWPVLEMDM